MPWCESCSKYLTPTGLKTDGSCPTCGGQVGETEERAAQEAQDEGTPWHFKLLIGAVGLYLGFRAVQMIGWLF